MNERYRYYICDVFTATRFGGNPLAVLPAAEGLSTRQMQCIAREFNFSETTFVLPAEHGHTRRVRIFTPAREMPFAGHPNIGTAFVLASIGEFDDLGASLTVTFEEEAGIVPIAIHRENGKIHCELSAPEALALGKTVAPELVAAALSLAPGDIVLTRHAPRVVSVGLPFLMAEVASRRALERVRLNASGFDAIAAEGVPADVHLYTRGGDGFDYRARMFAPLEGVPEDPATGSANCALAGLLAELEPEPDGTFRWRVAQGETMGRPSVLDIAAEKRGGTVVATRVGGRSVMFAEGSLEIEPE